MGDRLATRHRPKIGGLCPSSGRELSPHLTQCRLRQDLPPRQVAYFDTSSRLATIHQRYRQTDRQRTDCIGRTVLQTVAQKIGLTTYFYRINE